MGWFDDLLNIGTDENPEEKSAEKLPEGQSSSSPEGEGKSDGEEKVTSDAPLFPKSQDWEDFKASRRA